MKRSFEIEWPDEKGEGWLNKASLLLCLEAKSKGTKFQVKDEGFCKAEEADLLELAWGIIANAGGGDWNKENKDWIDAATRWRDKWTELAGHARKPSEKEIFDPTYGYIAHVDWGKGDASVPEVSGIDQGLKKASGVAPKDEMLDILDSEA